MSSKFRFLWNRLSRLKVQYRAIALGVPSVSVLRIPKNNSVIPSVLGFSLFTWLGFQKKLSAEDELIQTIKHCVLFIQMNEYDKAEQLLHIALRQAQQTHHQLGITYIYDVMANLALEREQLDKAKQLFVSVAQRIMADGAQEDDFRVVHISAKLARISHLKKDYSTAQLGYDWCLEKLQNMDNNSSESVKKLLALTEDWYGRMLVECNQVEQGLKLIISALDNMKEVPDIEPEHIVIQLNDIGTVCDSLGKYDDSIRYLKQAIELGKTLPEMYELGTMYVNLGRIYMKKSMFEEARKHCGFGWKLGVDAKNTDVKSEAELCLKEIKNMA